jgi:hypothetical protein
VRTVAGILLLIAGLIFPMIILIWMNGRLGRKPLPRPGEVGLLLTFNGVWPVALITTGLCLMSARLWATPALRIAMTAAWLASVVVLVALAFMTVSARRTGGKDVG